MRRLVGPAVALVALIALAAPVGATGPGKNGRLLVSTASGIVIMDANGGNADTVVSGTVYSPAWSPDGSRFAVVQNGDIWTYDAAGLNPVQVTSGSAEDETPAWSPDGARIAFGRVLIGKEAIFVANASGSGTPKQLSKPAAGLYDFYPAWSPDGKRIAFNRDKNHGYKSYDIWVMNANGTAAKGWIDDGVFNGYPAWSPDSKRIAYEQAVKGVTVLRTRAYPGGKAKTVVSTTAYEPEYSPDGRKIVFMTSSGVYVVPVAGGAKTFITSSAGSPSWQPLCNQGPATSITGTSKAELLCGTSGPDTIHAGGGGDHVFTYGDADTLLGDGGDDVLVGGDSTDTFDGGPGSDQCVQGEGSGTRVGCERS